MKEVKKYKTVVQDVLNFIFEVDSTDPLRFNDTLTYDSMEEVTEDAIVHVQCKDGQVWATKFGAYYKLDSEPEDWLHYMSEYDTYEDYTDSDEMIDDICGY